jgi:hypothetical protein
MRCALWSDIRGDALRYKLFNHGTRQLNVVVMSCTLGSYTDLSDRSIADLVHYAEHAPRDRDSARTFQQGNDCRTECNQSARFRSQPGERRQGRTRTFGPAWCDCVTWVSHSVGTRHRDALPQKHLYMSRGLSVRHPGLVSRLLQETTEVTHCKNCLKP